MRRESNHAVLPPLLSFLLLIVGTWVGTAQPTGALPGLAGASVTVTNLSQLSELIGERSRVIASVHLEVIVCAASRAGIGVIVAQDDSGAELLELGAREETIVPGDRLRIDGERCLLRRRKMGVEISAAPLVDNDGIHPLQPASARVFLKAGQHPIRLDWFNGLRQSGLEVSCQTPGDPEKKVLVSGGLMSGLKAESFEGNWESIPEFDLLEAVKTGEASRFDIGFGTRPELVAVRFTGQFNAPVDGDYMFEVQSDDGGLLYLGNPRIPVSKVGTSTVPAARELMINEPMTGANERRWAVLEGRVDFVNRAGRGLAFELRSDPGSIWGTLADADGIDLELLLNSRVRISGIARSALTSDGRLVLGRVAVASGREITILENAPSTSRPRLPLTAAAQIQSLPIDDAKAGQPVRIRGVVTSVSAPSWMSVQDATRGIFVKLSVITNIVPVSGQSYEIVGHTEAGGFAPVIAAERVVPLGDGCLPTPARPTWSEFINGSMDVQWVEFQGLVTKIETNAMTLLLPEGHVDVLMEDYRYSELKPFEGAVVRIRGVFFAVWETKTRAVRIGTVVMRNASISVDKPVSVDVFDVQAKRPRDLFLFDPHATAFQRVKVRGQVVLVEPGQIFMMDDDAGMRVLTGDTAEVKIGDVLEAAGYPDISGSAPLLREASIRRVSTAPLPPAQVLDENNFKQANLDSTLVRIDGRLVGMHSEQDSRVLEMRAYGHLFLARLESKSAAGLSLQPGSQLVLTGVYLRNRGGNLKYAEAETFELALNSPAGVVVLAEPPWWTPKRLLTIVGVLVIGLASAAIWISLLRRQVETRTRQLHREIREREAAERQRALESERSRIARDLHDDLGSSLTEIGVLASTGQRPAAGEDAPGLFQAIATKARALIAALDVIVWAVDPEDNSLQSVADYLSGFAGEYLSRTTIACRFKIPVSFPDLILDGRVRHDLLLTVKETLNNIVRHGLASEVEFRMAVNGSTLEIGIADNGKGFDPATARGGSGLRNLSTRLANHGGDCRIESIVGKGTTVTIRLPLAPALKTNAMLTD